MNSLITHLKIGESYIDKGTVEEWHEKLGEQKMFFNITTYGKGLVTIERIRKISLEKSIANDMFNKLKLWDGKPIIIQGSGNTSRMYISKFNKENNDCFHTKKLDNGNVSVTKKSADIKKKKTFSINEYKFIRNELISEIFDLQRKMFGFVSESECALSLIDELDVLSKPIHMREMLLKHENNRIKKILNRNEIIENSDEVIIDDAPVMNMDAPVREVLIIDQSDDDENEDFDWESELED